MWRPVTSEPNSGVMGVNYLIGFDDPVAHAEHYRGHEDGDCGLWVLGLRSDSDPALLPPRLAAHARGQGGRLPAVAKARGIGWTLVWFEPGDRNEERRKKNSGAYCRRDCMYCNTGRPHGKESR